MTTLRFSTDAAIDREAVRRFSDAMLDKLDRARLKGRGGWYDPEWTSEYLAGLAVDHLFKTNDDENLIDVANLLMMLYMRKVAPDLLFKELKERLTRTIMQEVTEHLRAMKSGGLPTPAQDASENPESGSEGVFQSRRATDAQSTEPPQDAREAVLMNPRIHPICKPQHHRFVDSCPHCGEPLPGGSLTWSYYVEKDGMERWVSHPVGLVEYHITRAADPAALFRVQRKGGKPTSPPGGAALFALNEAKMVAEKLAKGLTLSQALNL